MFTLSKRSISPLFQNHNISLVAAMIFTGFSSNTIQISVSEYDYIYAEDYRKFRLQRIESVGENFITCGDYLYGSHVSTARIKNADRTISDYFHAKDFISAHPAVINGHCCFLSVWRN
jgi:hypothetical protein